MRNQPTIHRIKISSRFERQSIQISGSHAVPDHFSPTLTSVDTEPHHTSCRERGGKESAENDSYQRTRDVLTNDQPQPWTPSNITQVAESGGVEQKSQPRTTVTSERATSQRTPSLLSFLFRLCPAKPAYKNPNPPFL